jgi:hypothetical protein
VHFPITLYCGNHHKNLLNLVGMVDMVVKMDKDFLLLDIIRKHFMIDIVDLVGMVDKDKVWPSWPWWIAKIQQLCWYKEPKCR